MDGALAPEIRPKLRGRDMPQPSWKQLLDGYPWHRGPDSYPLAAYSEFMPPPRLGRLPYGNMRAGFEPLGDPGGWPVTEYEESHELAPGLEQVARQVVGAIARLGR